MSVPTEPLKVKQIMPSGGWVIHWTDDDEQIWEELLGWGIDFEDHVVPLTTDCDGDVVNALELWGDYAPWLEGPPITKPKKKKEKPTNEKQL